MSPRREKKRYVPVPFNDCHKVVLFCSDSQIEDDWVIPNGNLIL